MNVASDPYGRLEFVTDSTRSTLSRQAKAGTAMRLAAGIYVVGADVAPEAVTAEHMYSIAAHIWPGGVLVGVTAFAGGQPSRRRLFIGHPGPARTGPLKLPGVELVPVIAPGRLPGDQPFLNSGLYLSSTARQLIENITPVGRPSAHRAGTVAVEDRIDELARGSGPGRIERTLKELDTIAGHFDQRLVDETRRRLAAANGTATSGIRSPRLAARTSGQPYDVHRVAMLDRLISDLSNAAPSPVAAPTDIGQLPFFEAYFSNFIEGTEFGVEEALRIATEGFTPDGRHADAHDVAATFVLTTDPTERARVPASGSELIDILSDRNARLMAARPDKRPGEFKDIQNFAGGYQFVDPDLVRGTLLAGFDRVSGVIDPMIRALAMMVLVTEIHPFYDGNGRVSRLMANAELTHAGQARVIIPTVYRNNYLSGLRAISSGYPATSLLSIMTFAQRWTAAIDWSTFDTARGELTATHAFVDPGLAEADGLRLMMPKSG